LLFILIRKMMAEKTKKELAGERLTIQDLDGIVFISIEDLTEEEMVSYNESEPLE